MRIFSILAAACVAATSVATTAQEPLARPESVGELCNRESDYRGYAIWWTVNYQGLDLEHRPMVPGAERSQSVLFISDIGLFDEYSKGQHIRDEWIEKIESYGERPVNLLCFVREEDAEEYRDELFRWWALEIDEFGKRRKNPMVHEIDLKWLDD